MNFESALKAMREGKEVRNGKCRCGYRIDKDKELVDSTGDHAIFEQDELLSKDWEIIK